MSQFDIIPPETIKSGDATDAYFDRTVETLEYTSRNPNGVAEITADQLPTGNFELLAGVKNAAHLLEGTPTTMRGKLSGKKQVYRTDDGSHHVRLVHHKGSIDGEELLESLIRDSELVRNVSLDAATEQAMADAERTDFAP